LSYGPIYLILLIVNHILQFNFACTGCPLVVQITELFSPIFAFNRSVASTLCFGNVLIYAACVTAILLWRRIPWIVLSSTPRSRADWILEHARQSTGWSHPRTEPQSCSGTRSSRVACDHLRGCDPRSMSTPNDSENWRLGHLQPRQTRLPPSALHSKNAKRSITLTPESSKEIIPSELTPTRWPKRTSRSIVCCRKISSCSRDVQSLS